MTRSIRGKYLEPIGIAEVNGSFGFGPKAKFGAFIAKTVAGSWVSSCDMSGVENRFEEKDTYIRKAMKRNRVLGRRILMIIAKYQKSFMDQSFLLGDEGGVFDQLCHNLASLCFALSMDKREADYLKVAAALDFEAGLRLKGEECNPWLQKQWAEIGKIVMDRESTLHKDLIADIDVQPIPLDPRHIDRYI